MPVSGELGAIASWKSREVLPQPGLMALGAWCFKQRPSRGASQVNVVCVWGAAACIEMTTRKEQNGEGDPAGH